MSTNIPFPKANQVKAVTENIGFLRKQVKKWVYAQQEFREYGMMYDDNYRDGHDDVSEAVRRLPEDLYTARIHRQHRAMQLSRNKIVLPEVMWPKIEDPMHKYLTPYLNDVIKERLEKAAWEKK